MKILVVLNVTMPTMQMVILIQQPVINQIALIVMQLIQFRSNYSSDALAVTEEKLQ